MSRVPPDFLERSSRTAVEMPMRRVLFIILVCPILLCSCATQKPVPSQLPANTPFNKTAGRGDELLVTLHLEDGEPLLFLLDTGTWKTFFDISLESKLGASYWTYHFRHDYYGSKSVKFHKSPKLYLGDAQLALNRWVCAGDLSGLSGEMKRQTRLDRRIVGVLGMDCLRHYCIQLDFECNEMRFLDASRLDRKQLGKPFSLVSRPFVANCLFVHENLAGAKSPEAIIDTGCNFDGWLTPALFRQWTNSAEPAVRGKARSPNAVLAGDVYPASFLTVGGSGFNGIGLRLLAQHLVTFDFPDRTMYLKRTSAGPLHDPISGAAVKFLKSLEEENQLPGWSKKESGTFDLPSDFFNGIYPASITCTAEQNGDSSVYHYTAIQATEGGPWKLQMAWRTSGDGRVIEKFAVQ